MSTSSFGDAVREQPTTAIVWVWLPGATEPIPAGRVDQVGESLVFRYGERYLQRDRRIALYEPELPLRSGEHVPQERTHGCLLDAGPDAWGRRVILHRRLGQGARDTEDLRPLTYLTSAGSDRIGGLDFQASASEYVPRATPTASLDELVEAARRLEEGVPLIPALAEALLRGSSIGGARPKALLDDGDRRLIAKFSSTTDSFPVVQGEFVAMRLAKLAGLNVANVELAESMGKRILLVERFDRLPGGCRRLMVSALTVLGLGENGGRYASYADLARIVRARFTNPDATLRELFSRITFNILTSNTDDHARNQAAFWDGENLELTPAYDICPYPRAGETEQLMAIGEDGWRYSQLAGCVARASTYHLSKDEAQAIVDEQRSVIEAHWDDVCDEAQLTRAQRDDFWGKQFLNPFALQTSHTHLLREH
ncbi:MAG: type II toxin-antitoxin system HipA family toxin [Solirubrobacteraceae bacterium]